MGISFSGFPFIPSPSLSFPFHPPAFLSFLSVGGALQVTTTAFFDYVLPPLPPRINLDTLVDSHLRTGGCSAPVTIHGRLWGYNKKDPSGIHSKDEKVAYAHVPRAFKDFAAATGREQWLSFRNNPKAVPSLASRTDDTLPDAYIASATAGDALGWHDIVVPGEYKVQDSEDAAQEVSLGMLAILPPLTSPAERRKDRKKLDELYAA